MGISIFGWEETVESDKKVSITAQQLIDLYLQDSVNNQHELSFSLRKGTTYRVEKR